MSDTLKVTDLVGIDPDEIMAVGVTGKGWGCCYLDAAHRPVRNGILWNDARSGSYIQQWARDNTLEQAFKISGNYYYTGDCGPITRWLMDHEPENARRTATALFPTDWIAFKLTGNLRLVHGDACSLFDMRTWTYSDTIFDLLGISSMRRALRSPSAESRAMMRSRIRSAKYRRPSRSPQDEEEERSISEDR